MKKFTRIVLTFGFTTAMAVTTAVSQTPNGTWTFDENGLGLFESPFLVGYTIGAVQLDPTSGISTLYYNWGTPTIAGDVLLFENLQTNISDVLRFDGLGGMYFFSELEPGELIHDLADVPQFPTSFLNIVVLPEIGPEGNNGAFYTPLPGQPGFDISGVFPNVSYHFVSDVVPEPSSMVLLLTGAAYLSFTVMRRKLRP